jgi:superfamily II DNA helicase RecQ
VIIAPLISIMSEQCKKLEGLDFNATYIGKDSSENDLIEKAEFDFIYGSPEQFVGDLKWRSVLKSSQFQEKMKAIVVDEAHTVIQW